MTAGHTAGPWKLIWHGVEQYPFPLSVHSEDGSSWIARDGTVSSQANAHLIAASPEMKDALQRLDDWWTESFPNGPDGSGECWGGLGRLSEETLVIWRQVRAALAKASPTTPPDRTVRGQDQDRRGDHG